MGKWLGLRLGKWLEFLTLYENVQYDGPSPEILAHKLFDVLPKTFF